MGQGRIHVSEVGIYMLTHVGSHGLHWQDCCPPMGMETKQKESRTLTRCLDKDNGQHPAVRLKPGARELKNCRVQTLRK